MVLTLAALCLPPSQLACFEAAAPDAEACIADGAMTLAEPLLAEPLLAELDCEEREAFSRAPSWQATLCAAPILRMVLLPTAWQGRHSHSDDGSIASPSIASDLPALAWLQGGLFAPSRGARVAPWDPPLPPRVDRPRLERPPRLVRS